MRINYNSEDWATAVTPDADETWQVISGEALITATSDPSGEDGLHLRPGDAIKVASGTSVRYRKYGFWPVTIAREALGA